MNTGLYPNFRFTHQQERVLMENGWCLVDRCALKTFVGEHAIGNAHLEITTRGVSIFTNGRWRQDFALENSIPPILMMVQAYLDAPDDDEVAFIGRAILSGEKHFFPNTSPEMEAILQESRRERDTVLRNAHLKTLLQRERGGKFII